MSRTLQSALCVLVVLGAGVPLWWFFVARAPEAPPAPPRVLGPVVVDVAPLRRTDFPLGVEVYGTLLARRTARLAVEQPGRVASVLPTWRPGAFVQAGQVLLELDPRLFELDLERARAVHDEAVAGLAAAERERELAADLLEGVEESLAIARREHDRWRTLASRERVGQSQVDQARSVAVRAEGEVDAARARLLTAEVGENAARAREAQALAAVESAEEALERTRVVAPFAGRLAGRAPAVGTFLGVGLPVVELLDLSALHLSARVHEDHLEGLEEGMPARVTLPSRPGFETPGRVRAVGPASDPVTRNAPVEIEIDNALGERDEDVTRGLLAGLFARARIEAGVLEDVLLVDRRHLVWEGDRAHAFVMDEGRAHTVRREVELGRAVGEGFVVRAGLAEGELVVTAPLDRVRDGGEARVRSAGDGR